MAETNLQNSAALDQQEVVGMAFENGKILKPLLGAGLSMINSNMNGYTYGSTQSLVNAAWMGGVIYVTDMVAERMNMSGKEDRANGELPLGISAYEAGMTGVIYGGLMNVTIGDPNLMSNFATGAIIDAGASVLESYLLPKYIEWSSS